MISLVQMQYFQAVCKYENFTKAAEAMCVSAPALSSMMKKLEEECGQPLFVRKKNLVEITPEGRTLLKQVNLLLAQYERIGSMIERGELSRNVLNVGISTLTGHSLYPQLLSRFMEAHPNIRVFTFENTPTVLSRMLKDGDLDIILSNEYAAHSGFHSMHLCDTSHVLCVNPNDPLAAEHMVSIEQIAARPMILFSPPVMFNDWLKAEALKAGVTLNIVHTTDNVYMIERFIQSGAAVSILLSESLKDSEGIACIPFDKAWTHGVKLFWNGEQLASEPTKKFIAIAEEWYPH